MWPPGGKLAEAAPGQQLGKASRTISKDLPVPTALPGRSSGCAHTSVPQTLYSQGVGKGAANALAQIDHSDLPKCTIWTQNSDLFGLSGISLCNHIGSHG